MLETALEAERVPDLGNKRHAADRARERTQQDPIQTLFTAVGLFRSIFPGRGQFRIAHRAEAPAPQSRARFQPMDGATMAMSNRALLVYRCACLAAPESRCQELVR